MVAQAIPPKYTAQNPNLISYTFTEVNTNTGYIDFYFITDGTSFILSTNAYDAQNPYTTFSHAASESLTLRGTQDWDYTFQKAATIKGDFLFKSSIQQEDASGSSNNPECRMDIRIIHYDGTTETELVDSQGVTKQWLDSANPNGVVNINKGTIPARHFKAGEILRIEVQTYIKDDWTGGTADYKLWHDPAGKDFAGKHWPSATVTLPTVMKIAIPFRIED